MAAGDPDAAIDDLRRYVRAQPSDPEGYKDLARCLEVLGDSEAPEAQNRIRRFVEGSPVPASQGFMEGT